MKELDEVDMDIRVCDFFGKLTAYDEELGAHFRREYVRLGYEIALEKGFDPSIIDPKRAVMEKDVDPRFMEFMESSHPGFYEFIMERDTRILH